MRRESNSQQHTTVLCKQTNHRKSTPAQQLLEPKWQRGINRLQLGYLLHEETYVVLKDAWQQSPCASS
jgi:hypothetical protein